MSVGISHPSDMSSTLLSRLSSIFKQMSNYIKANSPFLIEASMVTLCFSAILSRYLILA
ncbi:uncharacterized protein LOC115620826 [Scaptodrosophila lebanonensis]|uniref:Uncharacterized protein LOC115620826 n=1 Tax=Drosophila lebanonensis TaxID=7225 RepID=A0A6J2T5B0_DROLE|nr:uncharacterized protein LOC115620826 [Scaptodrosophila lebanonensis]